MTDHIIETYEIFLLEKGFIKKNNIVRQVYFDSSDVISLIQGLWQYSSNYAIDIDGFLSNDNSLIHGFAIRRWLGQIKLLNPHKEEFLNKFINDDIIFPQEKILPPRSVEDDFLFHIGIVNSRELLKKKRNFHAYVKRLQNDSKTIFKASTVLNPVFWFDRYNEFIKDKSIIDISYEEIDIIELQKSDIYKLSNKILNSKREKLPFNNYKDSLAIAQLQLLIDEFVASNYQKPLPIIYATSTLQDTLQEIYNINNKYLSYSINGKRIKIFRDASFFEIDVILNNEGFEWGQESFKYLNDIRNEILNVIDEYYKASDKVENDVVNLFNEKILIEFFNKVWFADSGYKEIKNSILAAINYSDNYDSKVKHIIEKERQKLYNEYKDELELNNILKSLLQDLYNIKKDIDKKTMESFHRCDPFIQYGLYRFSLSDESVKDFKIIYENLYLYSYEQNASGYHDYEKAQSKLLYNLLIGIKDNNLHLINTLFTILWIYEKHDTIIKVAKYIDAKNKKNSIYEYNSFYAYYISALLFSSPYSDDNSSTIEKNVNRLRSIIKDSNNYKYKISLAFILFNKFLKISFNPIIPENTSQLQNSQMEKYYIIFEECHNIIKDVLVYLENTDLNSPSYRKRIYDYLVNIYLYYCTKAMKKNSFNDNIKVLDNYKKQLEDSVFYYNNILPTRYCDTLAWYNYRRAYLYKNEKNGVKARYHLDLSKYFNKQSTNGPQQNRSKTIYRTLSNAIKELEIELNDMGIMLDNDMDVADNVIIKYEVSTSINKYNPPILKLEYTVGWFKIFAFVYHMLSKPIPVDKVEEIINFNLWEQQNDVVLKTHPQLATQKIYYHITKESMTLIQEKFKSFDWIVVEQKNINNVQKTTWLRK